MHVPLKKCKAYEERWRKKDALLSVRTTNAAIYLYRVLVVTPCIKMQHFWYWLCNEGEIYGPETHKRQNVDGKFSIKRHHFVDSSLMKKHSSLSLTRCSNRNPLKGSFCELPVWLWHSALVGMPEQLRRAERWDGFSAISLLWALRPSII